MTEESPSSVFGMALTDMTNLLLATLLLTTHLDEDRVMTIDPLFCSQILPSPPEVEKYGKAY